MRHTARFLGCLAIAGLMAGTASAARVKVKVDHDKTFDFATLRTYSWHPDGAGELKLLEATGEDPAQLKARLEPLIVKSVEQSLATRGFRRVESGADFHVNYYVLIGPASSSQYAGQFLAPTPEWGVIPFQGATTSFEAFEQGSLILDVSAVAIRSVVWRGVARTEIDRQRSPAERQKRIEDGIAEMLKKFPPKK